MTYVYTRDSCTFYLSSTLSIYLRQASYVKLGFYKVYMFVRVLDFMFVIYVLITSDSQ